MAYRAGAEIANAVHEAEHPQVLGDGEVPRERRVRGGEVRPLQGLAAAPGEIEAVRVEDGVAHAGRAKVGIQPRIEGTLGQPQPARARARFSATWTW